MKFVRVQISKEAIQNLAKTARKPPKTGIFGDFKAVKLFERHSLSGF